MIIVSERDWGERYYKHTHPLFCTHSRTHVRITAVRDPQYPIAHSKYEWHIWHTGYRGRGIGGPPTTPNIRLPRTQTTKLLVLCVCSCLLRCIFFFFVVSFLFFLFVFGLLCLFYGYRFFGRFYFVGFIIVDFIIVINFICFICGFYRSFSLPFYLSVLSPPLSKVFVL